MRRSVFAVAATAAVLGLTVVSPAQSASGGRPAIELTASPQPVEVVGLPCLPSSLALGMTNTGGHDVYADAELNASGPVELERSVVSSWLPAWDPDHTVTTRVGVTAPRTAVPGDYTVTVRADRTRLTVPVRVLPLPGKGEGDNLALGEQAAASSTHGNFRLCGAVDGDRNSDNWSISTGWNDGTRSVFPDDYSVALARSVSIGRIETYTLDSARYPAGRFGIRDFDVQVRTGGAWQTVDLVRGNIAGRVTSTFDPVIADAVRVVVYDSNDHAYSRIMELEVYSR